jgi:glycosyltransferase involved in cell wall biosynthesis
LVRGVLDRDPGVSLCIPEAFFDHAENTWINAQLWGRTRRSAEASRRIRELAEYLKSTLYEFRERFDLDILIIQNALTIPMHIPLGVAITEFLLETGMPAIAHHHDFMWERQRFQISAVDDYLEMAFPPRVPHLQHVVINQAAREEIAWRKGLPSILVPNVFDFENPPGEPDDYAADVRRALGLLDDDLLILQPTRIVPRKGIENAIHLIRRSSCRAAHLVISHDSGDEGMEYARQIQHLARDEGVSLKLFGDRMADRRQLNQEGQKVYVLSDLYPHADLVTFPSLYEGFGNACWSRSTSAAVGHRALLGLSARHRAQGLSAAGHRRRRSTGAWSTRPAASSRTPTTANELVEHNYQVAVVSSAIGCCATACAA